MDITALHASPAADAAVSEITRYGLERNVVELDAYGFTVIPPEKTAAAPGFVERLRDAILRTHGARNDDPIDDYRTAELKTGLRNSWWLLEEDEAFVEAVLNPAALAIARWMCGQSAVMTGATWLLKGSNKAPGISTDDQTKPLLLHCDALAVPPPMSPYAHFCNTSWVLSDYSNEEDGPTVYVPGSHLFGRAPFLHEQDFTREDNPYRVVPLSAREGSLAVWHGATWHGALPRTTPGLRVTLALMWMRAYMKPIQDWRESDPNLLDRHPELPRLLGLEHLYPFKYEEEAGRAEALKVAGRDQFA
jgi:hypothetical protein